MASFIRLALAASAIYIYWTALDEIINHGPEAIARSHGGQFQFLTILGVSVSLLHQVTSVIASVSGLRVIAALESLLLQVAAPVEVLISLLYWSLKAYDPHLVLDPSVVFRFAPELDRALHLWPAIFESISAILIPTRLWHGGIVGPLAGFSSLVVAYWYWVHIAYEKNGFFPYPLFGVLDTTQRMYLFGGCVLVVFTIYKVLQAIQHLQN